MDINGFSFSNRHALLLKLKPSWLVRETYSP